MSAVPMRDGYGKALLELVEQHRDVLVLDADVAKSTRSEWVREKKPLSFLDVGISEQDLVGTAAGLALAGMVPFVSTYGVFLAGRAWDQIRNTVCCNHLNVKLAGAHGGISVGPDGATHQALEDVALMRVLPGMSVVVPCDSVETYKATKALYHKEGPCFIRFGREAVPVVTQEETPFELGKNLLMRQGTDVSIFANGFLVHQSLLAAQLLAAEGISARVVNVHTIKPLDEADVLRHAAETGAVVTAEEHQRSGGLGGLICETLSGALPVPVERLGIADTFGESGTPEELYQRYGLTPQAVAQAARRAIERKANSRNTG